MRNGLHGVWKSKALGSGGMWSTLPLVNPHGSNLPVKAIVAEGLALAWIIKNLFSGSAIQPW